MSAPFTIAEIDETTFPAWRELRLRALREHQLMFGEMHASYATLTIAEARDRFFTRRAEGTITFGAFTADGSLVGTAGMFREHGDRWQHKAVLWGMYVAPEHRGSGLADALVREVIARARATAGVRQLHLSLTSVNLTAKRLYERHGFRVWGTEPRAEFTDGIAYEYDYMALIFDEEAAP